MALTIEPVRTRDSLAEFITLPRRLYDGMPGFVAPLDRERRELLDPARSAFFTHGFAGYWIARAGHQAVGRISAQIDLAAQGSESDEIGLFGCLDAIDDGAVVRSLLGTAAEWLDRHGRRRIQGPFLLSVNGEPGLLVKGHLEPPVTMLPWHPPYLDPHLRASGYRHAMGFECYTLDFTNFAHHERLHTLGGNRLGSDFVVRDVRPQHLDADTELGRRLYNDAWQSNWGFTPLTEAEMRSLVRNLRHFMFPDSGFFIEFGGEPAAFVLIVPNISELAADLGGAPGLLGYAKLLFRLWKGRYRRVRFAVLGVAAKYRDSVLGARIAAAALEESRRRLKAHGIHEIVAGWILENNQGMIRVLKSIGFEHSHTYRVYERQPLG